MIFVYLFLFCLVMVVILFYLMGKVIKIQEREENDPVFAAKMDAFRDKYGKWYDFFWNLSGWVCVFVFLYFWVFK